MGEKEQNISQGGLEQPTKGLKTRLSRIWPLNVIEEKIRERILRRECVREILTASMQAGIEPTEVYLTTQKVDLPYTYSNVNNLVRKELEELKKQGTRYSIEFFVDDGSKPIPNEYLRKLASSHGPTASYGPIGETQIKNYESQMQEYRQKSKEILEKIVKPELQKHPSYLRDQERYREGLAEWERQYKEWGEKPAAYWTELVQSLPEESECGRCQGYGVIIQYANPDYYCPHCNGTGRASRPSAEEARGGSEPLKPYPASINVTIQSRRLEEEIEKMGIKFPMEQNRVYARFIVEE